MLFTQSANNGAYPLTSGDAISNGSKLLLIGGFNTTTGINSDAIWSSVDDGATWVEETPSAGFGPRRFHRVVSHGGYIYLLGGRLTDLSIDANDVWRSADGISGWTRVTAAAGWSIRHALNVCSDGDYIYVAGGWQSPYAVKDVWRSADGITWTLRTASAGWSNRQQAGLQYLQGKLWIFGGYGHDGGGRDDSWFSTDGGATWTQSGNIGMAGGGRYGSTMQFLYANKLWIGAGYSYATGLTYNDLYFSTGDGTWHRLNNESFTPRYYANAVPHNGRVHIVGGYDPIAGAATTDDWGYTALAVDNAHIITHSDSVVISGVRTPGATVTCDYALSSVNYPSDATYQVLLFGLSVGMVEIGLMETLGALVNTAVTTVEYTGSAEYSEGCWIKGADGLPVQVQLYIQGADGSPVFIPAVYAAV